jgi:hypothetical protein
MPLDETPTTPDPAANPWPELDRRLLEDGRPSPVPFPLALLPDTWAAWVERSAQSFTPVDYLAQGLFAAMATVCGGGIVARVTPQWSEPLVLWQALVGGPSSGKSPALASARRLLDGIAADTDGADDDAAAPAFADEDTLCPLAGSLKSSPRGIMLWRDDLADWLVAARRGPDRAGWLAGWNVGEIVARQTGWFTQRVARFPLSLVGALRPDRLAEIVGEDDCGFAARLLYAWPEAAACAALSERPADDEGVRALLKRISRLAGTASSPSTMSFEPQAVARLEQLLPELQQRMRQAEGAEAGWIGKGAGTIVRLAGMLELMHWAQESREEVPGDVGRRRLEDAHALWAGYLLPHAHSVLHRVGAADGDRTARRAARWLRRAGLDRVSREDIRCEALCRSVDAESADQVIERLEAGGVLRTLASAKNHGRPKRRWQVNPGLLRLSGISGSAAAP